MRGHERHGRPHDHNAWRGPSPVKDHQSAVASLSTAQACMVTFSEDVARAEVEIFEHEARRQLRNGYLQPRGTSGESAPKGFELISSKPENQISGCVSSPRIVYSYPPNQEALCNTSTASNAGVPVSAMGTQPRGRAMTRVPRAPECLGSSGNRGSSTPSNSPNSVGELRTSSRDAADGPRMLSVGTCCYLSEDLPDDETDSDFEIRKPLQLRAVGVADTRSHSPVRQPRTDGLVNSDVMERLPPPQSGKLLGRSERHQVERQDKLGSQPIDEPDAEMARPSELRLATKPQGASGAPVQDVRRMALASARGLATDKRTANSMCLHQQSFPRPLSLVLTRLRRAQMLEAVLRSEIEREAIEDIVALFDYFYEGLRDLLIAHSGRGGSTSRLWLDKTPPSSNGGSGTPAWESGHGAPDEDDGENGTPVSRPVPPPRPTPRVAHATPRPWESPRSALPHGSVGSMESSSSVLMTPIRRDSALAGLHSCHPPADGASAAWDSWTHRHDDRSSWRNAPYYSAALNAYVLSDLTLQPLATRPPHSSASVGWRSGRVASTSRYTPRPGDLLSAIEGSHVYTLGDIRQWEQWRDPTREYFITLVRDGKRKIHVRVDPMIDRSAY